MTLKSFSLSIASLLSKFTHKDILLITALKNTHLFDHLSKEQFSGLVAGVKTIHYSAGSVILQQNQLGDHFYIIKSGSVRIYFINDNTEVALARLEPGDYFGEQALLDEAAGKRSASAKTLKKTTLYAIPHAIYSKIVESSVKEKLKRVGEEQLIDKLSKQLQTFSAIPPDFLHDFAGKVIHYAKGDVIFKLNDPADNAYFILSGSVGIEFAEKTDKEHFIQLGPGQLFGEVGALQGTLRAGTAKAADQLTVLAFSVEAFKKMHAAFPELSQLVSTMANVYRIPQRGTVSLYHGRFLEMPAVSAVYQLENGASVVSSKVVGKPLFTMAFNHVEGTEILRYRHGKTIRRELVLKENKIIRLMSVGEWEDLEEACDLLLSAKAMTQQQIRLFSQEGILSKAKQKIVSTAGKNEILCHCMQVTQGSIYDIIQGGVGEVSEVSKLTGAGTVCGSCRPKMVELLGMKAWVPAKLIQMIPLNAEIRAFRFRPTESFPHNYEPGQHIVVQAFIDNQFISRSFTLTSVSGQNDYVEIIVKREPKGYFSQWLFAHADDCPLIRISAPQGNFQLKANHTVPVVCFVGGIGVTPALAFARAISLHHPHQHLHIDYSAHSQADFIMQNEFLQLMEQRETMMVKCRVTQEKGRLQFEDVKMLVQHFKNADFYICGPKSFEQSIIAMLDKLNVPQDKISTEQFIHAGGPVEMQKEV